MLPIEAGVMKADPVYIRQRIPKLQQMIVDEMSLFEGQVYLIDSMTVQGINNQAKILARQSFVHFAIIFQHLEQLREMVEATNGIADYYFQIYESYKAQRPYAWLAFERMQKEIFEGLQGTVLTMWKEKMKQLGQDIPKGMGGGVSALEDVPRETLQPEQPPIKSDRNMRKLVKESDIPRIERPLDERDFKAPMRLPVTPEIRNHLPPQAFEQEEEQEVEPAKPIVKKSKVLVPVKKKARKQSPKLTNGEVDEIVENIKNPPAKTASELKREKLLKELEEMDAEEEAKGEVPRTSLRSKGTIKQGVSDL